MPKAKKATYKNIDVIRHKDKRTNIPTEELKGFVEKEEESPKKLLYPRDPSLDPQLVWKGKDEQDSQDLEVPAVPIYIQEKIHPKHIIEDMRAQAKEGKPAQLELFADFNGLEFEELVEFYKHEQRWTNRMILGDSLLVMTSLAEKERLKGKVQMIYIDPPYGIKFGSNWQVSTRKRDVKDGAAGDTTRQPEQIKAFRDTWKLGIHSYLSYLRDRLVIARDLLTETGSVFIQIGDENVHLVQCLMDEVFGSENHISTIRFMKTSGFASDYLDNICDHILWYSKSKEQTKYRQLYEAKFIGSQRADTYTHVLLPTGKIRTITPKEKFDATLLDSGNRVFAVGDLTSQGASSNQQPFKFEGQIYHPGPNLHWKAKWPEGMNRLAIARRIIKRERGGLAYVRFIDDFPATPLNNIWTDTSSSFSERFYVVQTTPTVVARCLLMTTDPGDLVLDPTCGGGTTAYVAEQWGRRWITIDTSRVALALARTRLMSAKFPYYLMSDSPDGVKKESEITGRTPPEYKTENDIRKGFVYERVSHITLKSISNNSDIKEGMSRK
ncbi:site-specific DNA-methyltransferase [Chloroflexota bacterium]